MAMIITCLEITAFTASLIAWPWIKNTGYLRWFPVLLFIIAFVEGAQEFFRPYFPYFNSDFYNIQVPLQHLLYLLILYHAIISPVKKRFIIVSGAAFIAITLVTLIFYTKPDRFNVLSYCAGSGMLILWILIRFYEMLEKPSDFNFLQTPFFYMLFACLLFNVGTLPYFLMTNWLHFIQEHREITVVFIRVMGVLNCILYGTYTLAFLWIRLKKAHY